MTLIEKTWTTPKYPDAKKLRDAEARELRKQGFKVEIETWDFGGLGYGKSFRLTATKAKGD